jgi:hypothetical protein
VRAYLEKNPSQKGVVEWLKVQALSSNPRTAKKKRLTFLFVLLHFCSAGDQTQGLRHIWQVLSGSATNPAQFSFNFNNYVTVYICL